MDFAIHTKKIYRPKTFPLTLDKFKQQLKILWMLAILKINVSLSSKYFVKIEIQSIWQIFQFQQNLEKYNKSIFNLLTKIYRLIAFIKLCKKHICNRRFRSLISYKMQNKQLLLTLYNASIAWAEFPFSVIRSNL